jgi:hypothetical protein
MTVASRIAFGAGANWFRRGVTILLGASAGFVSEFAAKQLSLARRQPSLSV